MEKQGAICYPLGNNRKDPLVEAWKLLNDS